MRNWQTPVLSISLLGMLILGGCSAGVHEHYVSPKIEGTAEKINLDEVQKAFWATQGKDFNGWMGAFEKRVNQIYDGKDVVSVDATRESGKLIVTGFIDKNGKEGFQPGDEKLFSIEQTGDAVNNEMPYRVAGNEGRPYYEGHHSILDNPILQMMLVSHMMGGWGGRYYTPTPQVVILQHSRDQWRSTPQYSQQQASNQGFFSRFKTSSAGDIQSRTKFGSGLGSPASSSRSFGSSSSGLGSSTTSSGSSGSLWGGRRSSGFGSSSSGFGSFGGSRRSFGGFRRGR